MSFLNPFSWGKDSPSSESSGQTSETSPPVVVPVQSLKQPNPPVPTSPTPPRLNPVSMAPPPPPVQPIPKPQSAITEPVNLTKVELDELKRKVDLIAMNVTKVANENERLVRLQEQWATNFSDRQKVQEISGKLTIENDRVKLLESKVRDSGEEIKSYQGSLEAQETKINSLEAQLRALKSNLDEVTLERDEASKAKASADIALADLTVTKDTLELEKQAAVSRGDVLATDLSNARGDCISKADELRTIIAGISSRLANFMPQGILESKLAAEVTAFDSLASSGDQPSLRVMAGLSQLRAAFISGAGPDDKLAAVKSIGAALYAAWSTQSKDAKTIHLLFTEWQNFLNDLPGAGYQLVVPDLGQGVPQNVTPLDGAIKVNEVQLWIVKGGTGGTYSKGIVR